MFDFFDKDSDPTQTSRSTSPGQVRFDDRGNAIYEWRDSKLKEESPRASKMRERALASPALSLMEENPAPDVPVVRNDKGSRLGYNPYQSGHLVGKPKAAKKRDMRELSKWIETKRRMAAQTNDPLSEK